MQLDAFSPCLSRLLARDTTEVTIFFFFLLRLGGVKAEGPAWKAEGAGKEDRRD